jgi:hypothetical protein
MSRRITKKAWFGPKKYVGWGWSITSWEGRVVTGVFFVLVILCTLLWHGSALIPIVVLLLLYGLVVVLTGDPPGSPKR